PEGSERKSESGERAHMEWFSRSTRHRPTTATDRPSVAAATSATKRGSESPGVGARVVHCVGVSPTPETGDRYPETKPAQSSRDSRALADGDLANAARAQERLHARAHVALQHDHRPVDRAAGAERLLELLRPALELGRLELELLDDRDLLA